MPDHGHPPSDRTTGAEPEPELELELELDEATRPRAPRHPDADADAGVGAGAGASSADALVYVHNHLRSELEQVRSVVAQVAAGQTTSGLARSLINRMSMRQNYWSLGAFCATYCRVLSLHHALEDSRLFVDLQSGDPELGPVIERLSEEHEVIADILTRLDLALVAMIKDPELLGEVDAAVERLSDALLSHLQYEEEELLGPLRRLGIQI